MVETEIRKFAQPGSSKGDQGGGGEGGIVWLTWESHRRTIVLSMALQVNLVILKHSGQHRLRCPELAVKTCGLLWSIDPDLIIVQNPSLILTLLCSLYKILFRKKLIVDRHTNFGFGRAPSLKKSLLTKLSDFTLRQADLTIVTNDFLKTYVLSKLGNAFVLHDRIPELLQGEGFTVAGTRNIVFICTYAHDEPYENVIRAAAKLPEEVCLYITGNPLKAEFSEETKAILDTKKNIHLTGFLDEQKYIDLLYASDVVMDLTTLDHCLVCGAYEALALRKPVVLSEKRANREYFGDIPVYVKNDPVDIAQGMAKALEHCEELSVDAERLKERLLSDWDRRFAELRKDVHGILNR
jgi:glycosyltransferase involved in cell wall biosynthesis